MSAHLYAGPEGASDRYAHARGEARSDPGRALYLVMNHVDGMDLHDWRADRQMRTAGERREVTRCLEQIAEVLDHLHSGMATPSGRVVVHGDLSHPAT